MTPRRFARSPPNLQTQLIVSCRTNEWLYRISLQTFVLETIFEFTNLAPRNVRALCPALKLIALSWGLQIYIKNWETHESAIVSAEDGELDELVSELISFVHNMLRLMRFDVALVEWHCVFVALPALYNVFAGSDYPTGSHTFLISVISRH